MRYREPTGSFPGIDFSTGPQSPDRREFFGNDFPGPAKFDAPRLCGGDALCLTLADIFPLCLGHIGEELQNNVRNEGADEVVFPAGIQQGHIQHHNVDLFLFRQKAPLL